MDKEVKNKKEEGKTIKTGIVVSDKMDKTVVVQLTRLKSHPKYLKKVKITKKYKVHDPENKFKVGDKVSFVGCRPMSKGKNWKIVEGSE